MAKKNRKSATSGTARQGISSCGERKNFQAVVYEDTGCVLQVSFLDGRWWITTPGEMLQPLEEYARDLDIEVYYLCEAGGKVGALALAKLLGKAMEMPECEVDVVLHQRICALLRLGVTLDVVDEPLTLELQVFQNPKDSLRRGKYSVWCYAVGNCHEELFDVDGFYSKQDAEECALCFFDFLESLGMEIIII